VRDNWVGKKIQVNQGGENPKEQNLIEKGCPEQRRLGTGVSSITNPEAFPGGERDLFLKHGWERQKKYRNWGDEVWGENHSGKRERATAFLHFL